MLQASANLGSLVAQTLRLSWRDSVDVPALSAETLKKSVPLILSTGAGSLAWHRLSRDPAATGSEALHEDYRRHAAEAILHEHAIKDLFKRVRKRSVEPILFKGWALARLYADPALRPYGDLDLWVRPEELDNVSRAFPADKNYPYCVELHVSFYPQYERSFDDVMTKSQLVPLDDAQIRVPGDEDHLRFICLHFLYHGGWRPLWLCDVGLMVESAGTGFDWDRCLRGKRKHADWVLCVIALAHQLLGADIAGTPAEERAKTLPRWLINAVLRQWGKGPGMSYAEKLTFSLPRNILKPSALARSFGEHWRNPIQASVEMNAWFNKSPRGLLQFGSAFLRIPEFTKNFGREIRRT